MARCKIVNANAEVVTRRRGLQTNVNKREQSIVIHSSYVPSVENDEIQSVDFRLLEDDWAVFLRNVARSFLRIIEALLEEYHDRLIRRTRKRKKGGKGRAEGAKTKKTTRNASGNISDNLLIKNREIDERRGKEKSEGRKAMKREKEE